MATRQTESIDGTLIVYPQRGVWAAIKAFIHPAGAPNLEIFEPILPFERLAITSIRTNRTIQEQGYRWFGVWAIKRPGEGAVVSRGRFATSNNATEPVRSRGYFREAASNLKITHRSLIPCIEKDAKGNIVLIFPSARAQLETSRRGATNLPVRFHKHVGM